ncbi:ribonuclease H [Candidatus Shapirobacteria bacterium CG10_big_fil_rev_8_21_14_0_10_48_15]|uniref:Ribonuclease H n=1 Tax=Candidatus Shapirobacteria bacterium CG10_big_fil_rev_8_21_14_0_10_48_15 TaxID=1974484 RepID=A0A2M8L7F1_9BACT|nr:MAG: ribonuclease H [Candidatus Shapirobacteria bacterium CG10_big_fil_rev_8_21_14_0_10_48_15]
MMALMEKPLFVHTDGGARGNPGPAAAGFIVRDDQKKILAQGQKYLGKTTNNVAEYAAVIAALQWLLNSPVTSPQSLITFFLDSKLVVNQLNGLYKIKDAKLRVLAIKVRGLEQQLGKKIIYHFVPRYQNKQADFLVNQCLDRELIIS